MRAPSSCRRISGRTSPYSGRAAQLHRQLHAARDALDGAQQLVGRVEAEVVAALAVREGHRVDQTHRARVGGEGGLDHQRAGQVAPLGR